VASLGSMTAKEMWGLNWKKFWLEMKYDGCEMYF